ncbi:MAG: ACP phosphodiesterase [Bacteroidales bacterium]|nr:ACP phosphodiesterase [Bacteroidales bacterium]
MNYLAHAYLSGNDKWIIIGNFIGDHVKGNDMDDYRPEVRRGIKLHRHIDYYTDTHPIVKQSINRLQDKYHKYAGVVVDMFYDHFLARYWKDYSSEDLHDFTKRIYKIISTHYFMLPGKTRWILPFMRRRDWMASYAELEGLQRALGGMAKRTPFQSDMEYAVQDLEENYDDFLEEFRSFFPELINHVEYVKSKI